MINNQYGGYRIYMDKVLLPVAPREIRSIGENRNQLVTLLGGGELNLLKTPGLFYWKFGVLLPNNPYPFARYEKGFVGANRFTSLFNRLKFERAVFDFVLLRFGQNSGNVTQRVSLEEWEIREDAAGNGDLWAELTLRQYLPYKGKVVTVKDNIASSEEERDDSSKPSVSGKRYVIQEGDTLPGIARRFLGDDSRAPEIYKRNKAVLDEAAREHGFGEEAGDWWIFAGTEIQL